MHLCVWVCACDEDSKKDHLDLFENHLRFSLHHLLKNKNTSSMHITWVEERCWVCLAGSWNFVSCWPVKRIFFCLSRSIDRCYSFTHFIISSIRFWFFLLSYHNSLSVVFMLSSFKLSILLLAPITFYDVNFTLSIFYVFYCLHKWVHNYYLVITSHWVRVCIYVCGLICYIYMFFNTWEKKECKWTLLYDDDWTIFPGNVVRSCFPISSDCNFMF